MAAPSTTPIQSRGAFTDLLALQPKEFGFPYYKRPFSYDPLAQDSFTDWERLQEIFPTADTVFSQDGSNNQFGTPVRLEAFWDVASDERGIAIFDNAHQLIVHVLTALFGYNGSGPAFSRQILDHFDVPEHFFDEIQTATWDRQPHKVVISREVFEENEFPSSQLYFPTTEVADAWTWWTVR